MVRYGWLLCMAAACADDSSDEGSVTDDGTTEEDKQQAAATPAFGSDTDVSEADALWAQMDGYDQWESFPGLEGIQPGMSPHGAFVRFYVNDICAESPDDPPDGSIIIKENFGDEAGTMLGAITVMEKREGYDAEGGDWFWAKYLPGGSLDANPEGVPLAGKVGGCRGCHMGAGEDRVFVN